MGGAHHDDDDADLSSQAGIRLYERGPAGVLTAARVYDDVEAPVEYAGAGGM